MAAIPAAVLSVLVKAEGIDRVSRQLDSLHRDAQKANVSLSGVETSSNKTAKAVGNLDSRFTHFDKTLGDFNRSATATKTLVDLIKFPAMIAAVGSATQAVGALAAGFVALSSAIAPTVGLAAGAAGGFVAMGQGLGVAKLALSGVGKALAGNKKALEALTPSQKKFVLSLKDTRKELKTLKETAAAGLLPGLTKSIKELQPLFKPLKDIIGATGRELGNLAVQAGKSVSTWGADLSSVGKNNVVVLDRLGKSAIALGTAFKDVLVVAEPLTRWMSDQLLRGAKFIQQQVAMGRSTGRLKAFFKEAQTTAAQLGRILANVGVVFYNIGRAAAPMGRALLTLIEQVTRKWRDFTGSAEGQNQLKDYFDRQKPAIIAMAGLLGDVAGALFRISQSPGLSGLIAQVRTVVPILEEVVTNTTVAFGPVVVSALTQVVRLFGTLGETNGPLFIATNLLGSVAGTLADIFQENPLLTAAVSTLLGLFGAWKAFATLFSPLVSGTQKLVTAWVGVARKAQDTTGQEQRAITAAQEAGTTGALAVDKLALAWKGVGAAAESATAAQTGAMGGAIGAAERKTPGGVILPRGVNLPPAPEVNETAVMGRFQRLTGRLSTYAQSAMRGVGIGIGGIVATSIASAMVGGNSGKWISAIGTGASFGAALGQVFEPIFGPAGPVGGAILGGLIGTFAKWVNDHAEDDGKRYWSKFSKNFQTPLSAAQQKTVVTAAQAAANDQREFQRVQAAQQQLRSGKQITSTAELTSRFGDVGAALKEANKNLPAAMAEVGKRAYDSAYKWGYDSAQVFVQQFSQVKVKTEPAFLQDAKLKLEDLPPVAQRTAAKAMIMYAQQLQNSGQLPKGAVADLVSYLQGHFAALVPFLVKSGLNVGNVVASTFKFEAAKKTLVQTSNNIRSTFGLWTQDPITNQKNYIKTVGEQWTQLKTIAATTHGAAHTAAVNAMRQLRHDTTATLAGEVSDTQTKMAQIKLAIQSNIPGATKAAKTAFTDMVNGPNGIVASMASGALSVAAGAKLIGQSVNAMLKAFGIPQIPIAGLTNKQITTSLSTFSGVQQYLGGAGTQGLHQGGLAQGGLVQIGARGARGQDAIPLDVGGTPIMVGAGEQVAVFNHHQQRVANAALAPMGGLAGLFSKVNRPHSMAKGGFIPGYQTGGVVGEVRAFMRAAGFNDIAIAGMLGNAEQESSLNVNEPGGGFWQQVTNFGTGTGGTLLNQMQVMLPQIQGLKAALNAASSPQVAADIFEKGFEIAGIPALANREKYAAQFYAQLTGNVAGGGGGGGNLGGTISLVAPTLMAPEVSGHGTVPEIAQAGLKKVTDAANAFLQKQVASLGPAAGGGQTSTSGLVPQVLAALAFARAHGWHGSVVSGFRSFAKQKAIYDSGVRPAAVPGTSLHETGQAVDVSDIPDFARAMAMAPPNAKLYSLVPNDPEHFSTTGHARGGFVHAQRGLLGDVVHGARRRRRPRYHPPKPVPNSIISIAAKNHPKWFPPSALRYAGTDTSYPLWKTFKDVDTMMPLYNQLDTLVNTTDPALAELMTATTNLESLETFQFVIDPPTYVDPATGETVQPASRLNPPDVKKRLDELNQVLEWYQERLKYLQDALRLIQRLQPLFAAAIKRRQTEMKRLRGLVHENVQKINKMAGELKTEQGKKAPKGLKGKALSDWTQQHNEKISSYRSQIPILEAQNVLIGGSKDSLGTGGHLADMTTKISSLQTASDNLTSWQTAIEGFGHGGTMQDVIQGIAQTQKDIAAMDPATLIAGGQFPTETRTPSAVSQVLAGVSQQIASQALERAAVSDLALRTFQQMPFMPGAPPGGLSRQAGLPPFGGSFQFGGTVPGQLGEPRTIIAHGGEVVGPATAHEIHLHFSPGTEWLRDFVQVEIHQSGRRDARTISRGLPGGR